MCLLIDADKNSATGWEGYDFIVNRTLDGDGKAWLEKNEGGWKWKKVAPRNLSREGITNCNSPAIPRKALGLPAWERLR